MGGGGREGMRRECERDVERRGGGVIDDRREETRRSKHTCNGKKRCSI